MLGARAVGEAGEGLGVRGVLGVERGLTARVAVDLVERLVREGSGLVEGRGGAVVNAVECFSSFTYCFAG